MTDGTVTAGLIDRLIRSCAGALGVHLSDDHVRGMRTHILEYIGAEICDRHQAEQRALRNGQQAA
jgi:hypothetical protein